ncbi:OmpA family protein [Methylocystis sp. S23]
MLDFYVFLWPWLAACFLAGAATGALAAGAPTRRGPARWLVWAGLAFLAAVAAAALGAVQGAISIYVESALGCFAAFIAGCAAGAYGFRRSFAAHERWALGLAPAALLWWGATHLAQPAYQAVLEKRVAALAQASGVDPSGVSFSGRDVAATPAIAGNEKLMARIAAAPGVRRIVAANVGETESPLKPAPPPSESGSDATATIAPPSDPKEILAALPAGDLDAATCQRALDAVAASEPVAFRPARATVNRRVAAALDKAAEIIRRCPSATIEVRGHGDEGAVEDTLSHRRAAAAERYLRREGVAGRRLVAVGCCAREERRAGAIDYILR